jgi:hypothetical protein
MSAEPRFAVVPSDRPADVTSKLDSALAFITIALGAGVAAYKVLLVWRLNVNWDEFYFLNHVYALSQGELTFLLQGAYTHAFTWLTLVPGQEVDQVVAGRLVMAARATLDARPRCHSAILRVPDVAADSGTRRVFPRGFDLGAVVCRCTSGPTLAWADAPSGLVGGCAPRCLLCGYGQSRLVRAAGLFCDSPRRVVAG